jgi:hypothetical protein
MKLSRLYYHIKLVEWIGTIAASAVLPEGVSWVSLPSFVMIITK